MIKEIYIDLDGVLCAFHKRFEELFGAEPTADYFPSNNKRNEHYRKNFADFIAGGNFATLMMLPDAAIGLDYVSGLNIPLRILSSTATAELWEEVSKQKIRWLDFYKIDIVPIFVPGKRHKKLYSGEGKVLIDDTFSVIESWNAVGGIGIHHSSWLKTISELKSFL